MGVSVIIVSWNTREMLLEALRSFLPLPVPGEVIVVDNASADGSADAVEAEFPDVRLIREDRNLGFAGGVNVGLRAAEHPLVLLLNPDTRVLRDAIVQLERYAEAHPEAGIIGPRVLNEDGTLQASRFQFPSLLNQLLAATYLYKLYPDSRMLNRERLGGSDASRAQTVDAVSGCCFLVRRSVLDQVGLLDESYFMYAEETDLCYRASQAGWEVHYAPVGEIVHLGGGASRLERRRNFLELRRSILRFFAKHRGRLQAELARCTMIAFLLLRLPYWGIRTLLPSASRDDAARQVAHYLVGIRFLLQPLTTILATPSAGDPVPRPH